MRLITNTRRAAVGILLAVLAALALYSTYANTRASAADSTWGHGDTVVVADSTWGVTAPPPPPAPGNLGGDQSGQTGPGQDQNPDTPNDSTWG
ncbi:hypothetical protein [Kitasatospora sp. NPDC085464]|uniref:hypothetical protein n=1 Tax=Kitasatospora sp. NPDC085464 TaxID=3364063 RepID=UPI0037C80F9B